MNEFIEKLIGRLEEKVVNRTFDESIKTKNLAYKEAIEIVNQLAEEYNNSWIPCSERLPELHEEVLVTQFFEDSERYNVTNASLISMLDGSERVRWCSYDHFITHVIAWQPLPAPYQPKGE